MNEQVSRSQAATAAVHILNILYIQCSIGFLCETHGNADVSTAVFADVVYSISQVCSATSLISLI